MEHELIATMALSLLAAFAASLVVVRLKLPPIVGYLLAGVAVGPHTPGFVGNTALAGQLAEIGVMLLMFGVGMHFSLADLRRVWKIDPDRLPKALMMRYNLQLVRATGENIRNLELVGVFRIPSKGTEQVHHDPATGRLMVTLGPAAAGARLAPFVLARRKSDASIVCCFVEES